MLASVYKIIEQFFTEKSTNLFPAKRKPASVSEFLARKPLIAPVPTPPDYRGRLAFDYQACIGCAMCEKVCPARAIEMYPVIEKEKRTKRIVIYLARCTFCSECVKVCPRDAITMSGDFMMADYDRNSPSLVVGLEERRKNEVAPEEKPDTPQE